MGRGGVVRDGSRWNNSDDDLRYHPISSWAISFITLPQVVQIFIVEIILTAVVCNALWMIQDNDTIKYIGGVWLGTVVVTVMLPAVTAEIYGSVIKSLKLLFYPFKMIFNFIFFSSNNSNNNNNNNGGSTPCITQDNMTALADAKSIRSEGSKEKKDTEALDDVQSPTAPDLSTKTTLTVNPNATAESKNNSHLPGTPTRGKKGSKSPSKALSSPPDNAKYTNSGSSNNRITTTTTTTTTNQVNKDKGEVQTKPTSPTKINSNSIDSSINESKGTSGISRSNTDENLSSLTLTVAGASASTNLIARPNVQGIDNANHHQLSSPIAISQNYSKNRNKLQHKKEKQRKGSSGSKRGLTRNSSSSNDNHSNCDLISSSHAKINGGITTDVDSDEGWGYEDEVDMMSLRSTDTSYTDLSEFDFNEDDKYGEDEHFNWVEDDEENTRVIILSKEQLKVKALIHHARKWRKYRDALISSVRAQLDLIMFDKNKIIRQKEKRRVKHLVRIAARQRRIRGAFVDYSKEVLRLRRIEKYKWARIRIATINECRRVWAIKESIRKKGIRVRTAFKTAARYERERRSLSFEETYMHHFLLKEREYNENKKMNVIEEECRHMYAQLEAAESLETSLMTAEEVYTRNYYREYKRWEIEQELQTCIDMEMEENHNKNVVDAEKRREKGEMDSMFSEERDTRVSLRIRRHDMRKALMIEARRLIDIRKERRRSARKKLILFAKEQKKKMKAKKEKKRRVSKELLKYAKVVKKDRKREQLINEGEKKIKKKKAKNALMEYARKQIALKADNKKEKKERLKMQHEEKRSTKMEIYYKALIDRQRAIDAKEHRKQLRQQKRLERDALKEQMTKAKLEREIAQHKQR